jgi:hypothetical protein
LIIISRGFIAITSVCFKAKSCLLPIVYRMTWTVVRAARRVNIFAARAIILKKTFAIPLFLVEHGGFGRQARVLPQKSLLVDFDGFCILSITLMRQFALGRHLFV